MLTGQSSTIFQLFTSKYQISDAADQEEFLKTISYVINCLFEQPRNLLCLVFSV